MLDRLQEGKSEGLLTHGKVGTRLSDITSERLIDIIRIYDQSVIGCTLPNPDLGWTPDFLPELQRALHSNEKYEFWFGSVINNDSILLVDSARRHDGGESIVTFSFDPNLPNPTDRQRAQAQRFGALFNREINRYLLANNIGILLPTESSKPVETEQSVAQLGDVLLDTAYMNDRVYRGPNQIDLGEFNEWVEELMAWTEGHPQRHEAGGYILINFPLGLTKASELIEGMHYKVEIPRDIAFIDYQRSKVNIFNSALGTVAHSHPNGLSFSPKDLEPILFDNSVPTAEVAAILITPRLKYIVFRGDKTPAMSPDEAENNADRRLIDYGIRTYSWGVSANSPLQASIRRVMGEIVEYPAVFFEMCRDWDLQVFKGERNEQVLHRWTLAQMDAEVQELRRIAR